MRKEFSEAIEKIALADKNVVFITGDLGYNALENVQKIMGNRFINAGVAEQNMVGMAAGMAYKGFKVFCYSIAPFVVYRCLEQFRNDVCLHNLPVFLVGNGGGYGYGIMGSTHHAIEDLACLAGLQNVNCYIPAFSDDISDSLHNIMEQARPAYLRLGIGKKTPDIAQKIPQGKQVSFSKSTPKYTVLALGPLVNNVLDAMEKIPKNNVFDVFSVTEVPFILPESIEKSIEKSQRVLVFEEHISTGGLAQQLALQLIERQVSPQIFQSFSAQGYPDGLYGSQNFHQKQSNLDIESIAKLLAS